MISTILQVAVGGAIGASLRFTAGLALARFSSPSFPIAVLSVNILGSFLMGCCVVIAMERNLTHLQPLVMTGVLGGFTTFSTFSLEAFTLFENGQTATAGLYVLLSVALSLLAISAGILLARCIV